MADHPTTVLEAGAAVLLSRGALHADKTIAAAIR